MKTESNQSKQDVSEGRSQRPHLQSSLFVRVNQQACWLLLAAFAVAFTVLFLAGGKTALAQDVFGRISGTVTDSQGAVIPNATITITDEQTKLARTLKSDGRGYYVADELAAGSYTVGIAQQGFKTTRRTGNVLDAGARLTVDLRLEPGATSTTVEVSAQGESINTVSGEIARTVDSQQVQTLALNERNYAQLVALIPGSALTTFDQTTMTTGMRTDGSSVNGRRADGNSFTVDGGFNLDSGSNASQSNNVGIDFIQEVAIKTSNFSAEYGRNSGASINVVTRRGGEAFHGTAFEYLRNDVFDAIRPQNKINVPPGTPTRNLVSTLRYNDFGWNFGGPILHKKLFFFAGEEWKRVRQLAQSQTLTLPTTAELQGDFRDLLPAAGPKPTDPGHLKQPSNAPAGCTVTNNVMSPQCISPDGAAMAAVYTRMIQVASTFNNATKQRNALFQPPAPENWREDIVRIDYQLSNAHSIYGLYIHDYLNSIDPFGTFAPGGSLPSTPTDRTRPGYGIQLADVWIITPRLINEAKFNASWNGQRIPPVGDLWKRSTYGFQFTPPLGFVGRFPDGIPRVTFTGIGNAFPTAAPTSFTGPFFALLSPQTDISPSDNLTWTLGSHTLKFGVMYARNRKDQNSRPDSYNGNINFQVAGNTTNTTNVPFADALMGNFQSFTQQSGDPIAHFRYNNIEGYVDDSWKVTRNLSLELGLRYQYIGPTYTQADNIANFDPSLYVPLSPSILSGSNFNLLSPGSPFLDQGFMIDGLVRAGRGVSSASPFIQAVPAGAPRSLYRAQGLFAPRFGFSWSPFSDNNTVLRGGFGIFYDKPEGNIIYPQPGVVPFIKSVTYNNNNLSNITGGSPATTIFSMNAVDPHFKQARSMQYSLSLQRQFPHGVLFEMAYVGNQGRHEVRRPNINVPTFEVVNANPITVKTNQERPFIGYADINQYRSDSNSNYNAFQLFASKRKGNFVSTLSYTWSRAMGNTSGIGDNPEPECAFVCTLPDGRVVTWHAFDYGRLSFDRQHILVVTYNYAFPFFRNSGGIAGVVLGGWELGGITRAQTGAAQTVTAGTQPVGSLNFTRRTDMAAGVPLYSNYVCPPATKCWFNPSAFVLAPNFRVGNAPTANIFGPGYNDWDISIRKRFRLPREGMNLLFQGDSFNLFNHANWGNPSVNAGAAGFGTINSAAPPRQLQFGLKLAF